MQAAAAFMRTTNGSIANSNHNNHFTDNGLFSMAGMSPHNPLNSGLSQSPLVASLSGSLDVSIYFVFLTKKFSSYWNWQNECHQL